MEFFERYPLPFDVYKKVLERLEKDEKELHSYLVECGFSVEEKEYSAIPSKLNIAFRTKREFWNAVAKKIRDARAINVDIISSEMKLLSDHIAKDGTILIGGCGNGDVPGWLKRNTNAKTIELDYSPNMLRNYEADRRSDCILANCTKIPTKDAMFDQVVMIGTDPDLNDRIFLNEIDRVLKRDGKILMSGLCDISGGCKPKSIVTYLRDIAEPRKLCDAFYREFMERCYDNVIVQTSVLCDAASSGYSDATIQESLEILDTLGFDAKYEVSTLSVMPRGSPYLHVFQIPYVIVGKKG